MSKSKYVDTHFRDILNLLPRFEPRTEPGGGANPAQSDTPFSIVVHY